MSNPDLLSGNYDYSDDDDMEVQYDEQDIDDNNQDATKVHEESPEEKELKKMREKIAKQRQREEEDEDNSDDAGDAGDDYRWKRHFGNNFTFFFSDTNEPLITLGPQWQFIICIVFSLISISFALIYLVAMKKSRAIQACSMIISGVQIIVYLLCALINPGIVSAKKQSQETEEISCEICEIHHDSRADVVHCEECNVCVQGYEKHCMLAGKCIGKGNALYYNLAIGMLPVYLIFFVIVAVT